MLQLNFWEIKIVSTITSLEARFVDLVETPMDYANECSPAAII